MTASPRFGTVLAVLVFSAGCADTNQPTPAASPIQPTRTQVPPVPPPSFEVPPLAGPAITYDFSGPLSYAVRPFTVTSRYVLYENGAFALDYPSGPTGGGTYAGIYQQEGDRISFRYSADAAPGAIGTLVGDVLEVRYSDMMQHSDFENAVYRRSTP